MCNSPLHHGPRLLKSCTDLPTASGTRCRHLDCVAWKVPRSWMIPPLDAGADAIDFSGVVLFWWIHTIAHRHHSHICRCCELFVGGLLRAGSRGQDDGKGAAF